MRAMPALAVAVVLAIPLLLSGDAATQTAPAAAEVTLKGVVLSTWNYYKHDYTKNANPRDFDLVLYAFDGPPDVQKTVEDVLAQCCPKLGLDAEHATKLQEQLDARLRYYVDADKTLVREFTYISGLASVTGTLEEKDGKKWLMNAKVTLEKNVSKPGFKYPPDCMLQPDKAFVMSKEKPIDLKVADGLTLKCVPVPPGTFIMGSPFYQCPRYQDECPHEVTLTKTFYISEIPITQEMFEAVMGKEKNRSRNRGAQLAVENTPFPDIREFCRIVSEKNGRTVRVPTAAEMEYVARLGTSNPCFPSKYAPLRTMVGGKKDAVPVKTKEPSAWGVYDLPAWGLTAVSDWKAANRPDKQVDPQGEPINSPLVISGPSVQKVDKPVEGMIMRRGHPAIHKGVSGADWNRPNMHDRYSEDGLDGGNGTYWVGIFRIVVEAEGK